MAGSKNKAIATSAMTPEQAFAAEAELAITTALQAMTPAELAKLKVMQALSPAVTATCVVGAFSSVGTLDNQTLVDQLVKDCFDGRDNDMKRAESMLVAQAYSLNAIFTKLALKAGHAEYMSQMEANLRLALKAQSQCRSTLETLAAIKNPPIFAKQANISHGHQQVNNGTFGTSTPAHTHAGETKNPPTELLEHDDGQWLDTGTTAAASGSHQAVEAVGAIHRPTQRQRQGNG
jgi:hypothetical protein